MKTRFVYGIVVCIAVALGGHGSAAAQRGSPQDAAPEDNEQSLDTRPSDSLGGAERPWARGVSPEEQEAALHLFKAGNAMLRDSLFVKAATKYREALRHWDHPAIHYNLALALVNLDEPLQVYRHLEKATAYGPAPLDKDKFDHALGYKALVEKQLARVEITCDVQDAQVTLDGEPIFVGPGTWKGLLRAGKHTITARAPGYIETSRARSLPAGELTEVPVRLYTEAELTRYRRRWDVWKPWAVTVSSAVVLLAGAALHLKAKSDLESFDREIRDCGGCVPSSSLLERKSRAGTFQSIATVTYGIGGAALLTGLTLVYLNRARSYRLEVEELERELRVAPVLAPDQAGFVAAFRF